MKKEVPITVYQVCLQGGLLTGSQAKRIAKGGNAIETSDWDIVVPFNRWEKVLPLIPQNSALNKFKGFKFTDSEGNDIDVWAADIHQFMSSSSLGSCVYVVNIIDNKVFESRSLH